METAKVILPSDDEAASIQTLTGWVDRLGFFWKDDERQARWCGATHVKCRECGKVVVKEWVVCADCRERKAVKHHAERQRRRWDGVQMIYSEATQRFYTSIDDVEDAHEGDAVSLNDLRLVLCDPVSPHLLSGEEFADELPEDNECPDDLQDAIDAFNRAVTGMVTCWMPSEIALDLSSDGAVANA